jgi:lipopolysaccharide transport system ATP-binding protein
MWAVRFEHVSKRFRKGGPAYTSIGAELGQLGRQLLTRARGKSFEPTGYLALDDVSFEVEEGESFALIGANGAGKSTALRLLSRISSPTGGRIRGRGRVGALIEVGSGVHLELTGRENIWLYGSILGIPRREIRRRFDEIVAFAELEKAIDTQVKYYSSGMQLRLGFSVAAHLEPEIFVVDEALSVGDAMFQERCVSRMNELVRSGTTVLFVSHNLPAVESLCVRGLMLDLGKVVTEGPIKHVLAEYISRTQQRRIDLAGLEENRGVVRIISAGCCNLDGEEQHVFAPHEGLELRLEFESSRPLERPMVSIGISDGRAAAVDNPSEALIACSMLEDGAAPQQVGTHWECRLRIEMLPLRPRLYQVWADVQDERGGGALMEWLEVAAFRVDAPVREGPQALASAALGGPVDVPYRWEILD